MFYARWKCIFLILIAHFYLSFIFQGHNIESAFLETHYKGSDLFIAFENTISNKHKLSTVLERDSSTATENSITRPLLGAPDMLYDGGLGKGSIDLEQQDDNGVVVEFPSKQNITRNIIADYCIWIRNSSNKYFEELKKTDFSMQALKCKIMFTRSFYVLAKREKMVFGTLLMHFFLAVNFGYIIGPSSDNYVAVTAMFGIGTMLLILTNVQFLFWIYQNNEVCFHIINILTVYSNIIFCLGLLKRTFEGPVFFFLALVNQ